MTLDQVIILSLLALMLTLFIWGKWRYDLISVGVLLIASVIGVVPPAEAFNGFGHPAVITVAAVLIVSKGLMNSGIVDFIASLMSKVGKQYFVQLASLVGAVTISSAFMNNIGALALFMPVAIRIARKSGKSPSLYLMPLAFGSLLGGMITLVGTPPNIIISNYRAETLGIEPFRMFDFTLVGAGVAIVGIFFIVLIGRNLIPEYKGNASKAELFKTREYITSLDVVESSKIKGITLGHIEMFSEGNVVVISHIRDGKNHSTPSLNRSIQEGDIIIVEANPNDLQEVIDAFGFKLESENFCETDKSCDEMGMIEAVVTVNSSLIGKTARKLNLRSRFEVNLIGVAREGARLSKAPNQIQIRAGDVLLLQGETENLQEVMSVLGYLPLAESGLTLGKNRRLLLGIGIFAVSILISALNLLPVEMAFTAAATVMVFTKFLTLKEVYESIDWSIIILLGAIIPVSQALEATGGAQIIANLILNISGFVPSWLTMMLMMITTILLSNVVNNAASTLIMAPIAVQIALGLDVSIDPFLMAVAIGASCAFLTPIGHQSNTLVMGPGGYKFGDYWRLGLPLTLLVVLSGTFLILMVWPL